MTAFVLDTSAVVAWVTQENRRWRAVDALISNPASEPLLPAPALTESIVIARRRGNRSSGARLLLTLEACGIALEPCLTPDLLRAAQLLEVSAANPGRPTASGRPSTLSFCDALILATTERLQLQVVTADRYWKEFAAGGFTTAGVQLL